MHHSPRRRFLKRAALAAGALAIGAPPVQPAETRPAGRRLRLSCAAYSYRDYLSGKAPTMDVPAFIETAAGLGVDGVELTGYYFPQPITERYLYDLKRRCYRAGLDISGTGHRSELRLPPGEARDREIARMQEWVDHASLLGAPFVRVFAGDPPIEAGDEQALAWVIESLRQLADYGRRRGVVIGMETHGRLTTNPANVLKIVQGVPGEWFGLNLDIANLQGDAYAAAAQLAPHAVSVHLKTEHIGGLRGQPMDYRRVVKLMTDAGYRGYLTLEYEGKAEAREAIPGAVGELKEALGV